MKRNKIGRNDLCPCGSGKKFKRCHGFHHPDQTYAEFFSDGTSSTGSSPFARPPISAVFNKERFVAVGNRLYHSARWITFHDFLMDYMKTCMGSDWGNVELRKPPAEMHPLIQWYIDLCDFQRDAAKSTKKVVYEATATGSVAAYLSIAFELYLLEHHRKLQTALLTRLRDKGQFQGARYELYVAALFVKAGMHIEYQDESDRSTSHCEFNSSDPLNGGLFSVEAKSRHRPGFLGFRGTRQNPDTIRLRVGELLNDALAKQADHDRIVFIDVNMPPEEQQAFDLSWFTAAANTLSEAEKRCKEPAIVFFTNIPNHYVGNDSPEPAKNYFLSAINKPDFRQREIEVTAKQNPTAMRLWKVMNEYAHVPHTF